MISTDDPSLSEFRDAGGKMITWHGITDRLVWVNRTLECYERVQKLDPNIKDFY